MAEPLSFAIEALLSKLISFLSDELSLVWGLKGDLEQLQHTFTYIKDSLQPQERKESEASKWLQDMRDVAYDAEDVLDEFSYEMLRQRAETNSKLKTKVRRFLLKCSRRQKMAHEVRSIKEKLVKLSDSGKTLGLLLEIQQRGANPRHKPFELPETHSLLLGSEAVIKRDEEVSLLAGLLANSTKTRGSLYVLSVIGMAGLGKTVLAKNIHQKLKTEKSFDLIIWICVGNTFDEKRILEQMFEYMDTTKATPQNMNLILEELKKSLANKRFLLILDDVWNEELRHWKSLEEKLLSFSGAQRNCVLVTTRSDRVAEIMESRKSHKPRILKPEECWKIIKFVTFGKDLVPVGLEETGMKIAEKCRGLPLVAGVVGGTLKQRKIQEEWVSILESEVWGCLAEQHIEPVLKLSYDRLPSVRLQRCFAYCAIFPKDTVMDMDEVVQRWISQGYFEETEKKSMRSIGNEHFNYLAASSFFQDIEVDPDSRYTSFKMHDALHDLACRISFESWNFEEEYPSDVSNLRLLNIGTSNEMLKRITESGAPRKIRAFHFGGDGHELNWECIKSWGSLRGLRALEIPSIGMDFGGDGDELNWECIESWGSLRGLRALEIPSIGMGMLRTSKYLKFLKVSVNIKVVREEEAMAKLELLLEYQSLWWKKHITKLYQLQCLIMRDCSWRIELPGIESFINLRCLVISQSRLEILPESVGNLPNLEVLDVSDTKIRVLPSSITKLDKLEIIDFRKCHLLEEFPKGVENLVSLKVMKFDDPKLTPIFIGKLTGLEELQCFGVRNEEGYRVEELGDLKKLKGRLDIHGLENVRSRDEAMRANLKAKSGLRSLSLHFGTGDEGCNNVEEVLQGLEPPGNIVKFTLEGCRGYRLPSWLSSGARLSQLEHLEIRNARFLKLEEVNTGGAQEANSFPSLKVLELADIVFSEDRVLKDILSTDFPALTNMRISGCRNLTSLPSMSGVKSLQELIIHGCGITSLPTWLSECESLEELQIEDCEELMSIQEWFGNLTSLKTLCIVKCINLSEFPVCSMSQLAEVHVGRFSKGLQEFPLYFLDAAASLRTLELVGWDGLKTLPSEITIFTNLNHLMITKFEDLEVLPDWRDNFPSLTILQIGGCGKLKCLPSMQFMQRLELFGIIECQELEGRCEEGGSEWHKVSQISLLVLHTKRITYRNGRKVDYFWD